jgi:hypothetical protein
VSCKKGSFSCEELLFLTPAHIIILNFGLLCLSTGIYNPQDLQKPLLFAEFLAES